MAQTTAAQPRPQLVAPRAAQRAETLDAVRKMTGGFDVDAWHVMEERDNALIADEILHGPGSSTFVYNFEIKGSAGCRDQRRRRPPPGGPLQGFEASPRRRDAKDRRAVRLHVLSGRKHADGGLVLDRP